MRVSDSADVVATEISRAPSSEGILILVTITHSVQVRIKMRVTAVVAVAVFLSSLVFADDKSFVGKNASDRGKQVKPDGQSESENQPVSSEIPTDRKEMRKDGNQVELIYPQPNILHATNTYESRHLRRSKYETKIREALESRIGRLEFTETRLCDVVACIADDFATEVHIDSKAFEDAGLDLETPLTKSISGVSLRSALRLLLGDLDLTYIIQDEVLLITTKDKAAEHIIVVSYPVAWSDDYQSLIEQIQNTVAPQTWNTVNGAGTIQPYPLNNEIVISQTGEVHDEILDLFRTIIDIDASSKDGSIITRTYQITDASLLPDVEKKLIEICNTALGEKGDPNAKITRIGKALAVQSRARTFHVYAAEVIRSLQGINNPQTDFSGAVTE